MGQPIPSVVITPPCGISHLFLRKLQKPHSGASKFLENLTTRVKNMSTMSHNILFGKFHKFYFYIKFTKKLPFLKIAENMKISNNNSPATGWNIDDKCPTVGKPDLTNARKGRSRLELTEPSGQ